MTPTSHARSLTRWALLHGTVRLAMKRATKAGDLQASFMTDPRYRTDPFAFYETVRSRGTLVRGKFANVTADHAVCQQVLVSDDFRAGPDEDTLPSPIRRAVAWSRDPLSLGPVDPPSMLAVEPPDHTRYRKMVSKVFTARAVEQLRSRTQSIADDLLDRMEGLPEVDLVERYCTLLPVAVISSILGVREQDYATVLDFGHKGAPSLDVGLAYRDFRVVDDAIRGFQSWLGAHLERLAREPGDDLLSQLVRTEDEGKRLTDTELRATAGLVLAAGFETTVNLLGSGTVLLLQNPDQLDALRDDPSLWTHAVDEVLRLEGPVQMTGRFAPARHRARRAAARARAASSSPTSAAPTATRRCSTARPSSTSAARTRATTSPSRPAATSASARRSRARRARSGCGRCSTATPTSQLDGPGRRRTTRVLRGWESLPVRTRALQPA